MNILERKKISVLIKQLTIWFVILFITLISINIINSHNGGILEVIDTFNYTAEKQIFFIPFGIFVICKIFDTREVYLIRFENKVQWLKREIEFIVKILLTYSLIYTSICLITKIFIQIMLYNCLEINLYMIGIIILSFIKRNIFLFLTLELIILGVIITKKKTYIISFCVYILMEILEIMEMQFYSEVPIIRTIVKINSSISKNIIWMLPMLGVLIFCTCLIFYKVSGEKKHA